MLRNHIRCARVLMAYNEHVDLHRIERLNGVDKALALHRGRGRTTCIDRIAGKTLLRQLERSARARRRLEEQIADSLATQCWHLLDRALIHLFEGFSVGEHRHDIFGGKLIDREQVLVIEHGYSPPTGAEPMRLPGSIGEIVTQE